MNMRVSVISSCTSKNILYYVYKDHRLMQMVVLFKSCRFFIPKLYQQNNHANMRNTWLDTDNSHLYSSARLVGFMEELAS